MAVKELRDYLENGNIKNSVNYPVCDLGVKTTQARIGILHLNVPNMIAQYTRVLGEANINITNFADKSRGEYAYSLMDVDSAVDESTLEGLRGIGGVLKVRLI